VTSLTFTEVLKKLGLDNAQAAQLPGVDVR
jgi:hypothetical protein